MRGRMSTRCIKQRAIHATDRSILRHVLALCALRKLQGFLFSPITGVIFGSACALRYVIYRVTGKSNLKRA